MVKLYFKTSIHLLSRNLDYDEEASSFDFELKYIISRFNLQFRRPMSHFPSSHDSSVTFPCSRKLFYGMSFHVLCSYITGFSSGILIICPVQRSFDILIVLITPASVYRVQFTIITNTAFSLYVMMKNSVFVNYTLYIQTQI